MDYKTIKKLIKSKGLKLSDIAEELGYTYNGFVNGIKTGTLRHNARVKLSDILNIPLSDFQEVSYQNKTNLQKVNEDVSKYESSLTGLLEDQIKVLTEQLIIKDEQLRFQAKTIENLLEIIKKLKSENK